MILRIFGFDDICFTTDQTISLIIEDNKLFAKIVLCLSQYADNASIDNEIIIVDDDYKIVKGNMINLIIDPIHIPFNDKIFINKLYAKINQDILNQQDIFEDYHKQINILNAIFINELNHYNFEFQLDNDIPIISYLKCLNVKIENNQAESIYERILKYIELCSEILANHIIIFINVLQYFDLYQIKEIEKYIAYKKINCLFIENVSTHQNILKKYIIDSDFCEQIY